MSLNTTLVIISVLYYVLANLYFTYYSNFLKLFFGYKLIVNDKQCIIQDTEKLKFFKIKNIHI